MLLDSWFDMICVFSSVASGIGGMEVFIVLFAQDVGLVLCSLPLGNGRTECILPNRMACEVLVSSCSPHSWCDQSFDPLRMCIQHISPGWWGSQRVVATRRQQTTGALTTSNFRKWPAKSKWHRSAARKGYLLSRCLLCRHRLFANAIANAGEQWRAERENNRQSSKYRE